MRKNLMFILAVIGYGFTCSAMELKVDTEQSTVVATAKATGHQFTAEPETFDCQMEISQEGQIQSVSFSFNFADLKTGKKKRDSEMLHWLDSESYPSLNYVMTELKQEDGQQILIGTVSIHGKTIELAVPVSVTKEEDGFRVTGDTSLDVTDFGLKKIRKFMMLTVNPKLEIHFDLRAAAS